MSLRDDLIKSRYLLDGETENGMWKRVAKFVADEKDVDACVKYLSNGDIIFNSPILMNAGKETPLASACYVLPMYDDMDSIMDAQALSAKIFKLGAGVGIDYSNLRPEGAPVGSGGTSSGPVSFMSLVDNLAEVIKSGGKRRAAIMATLRVDHPDIDKFIEHKKNDDKLLNTNISVMITDEFMANVKKGEEQATKRWNKIVHNAWKRGDPGLVFIDTVNKNTNRIKDLYYEGTNACSEFPLYPYESCLIGSINFGTLNPTKPTKELKERVRLVVRCLDNVIDKAWYPDKRIEEAAKRFRRIGVGLTGLADYLIKEGLRYGSTDAIAEVDRLLTAMEYAALDESNALAHEKGAFPEFDNIVWDARMEATELVPVRNIATTVVAPAGSTSILCGADGSGCEPLFALAYDRMMRREKEEWYTVVPDIVQDVFKRYNIELTPERVRSIKENSGSVCGLDWVPEEIQRFLVTAQDLNPDDHLDTLIAVQKRIGNSVSKTINLPNSATEKDIAAIFMRAYDNKVKGITVFRDGCKSTQVLKVGKKEEVPQKVEVNHLPDSLPCIRIKVPTPSGSMYVMTSFFKNTPVEVFCNLGKSGMDDYAYTEALGRLISLCLKNGIDYHHIVKTLKGIRGKDVSLFHNDYVYSVPDAIAIALRESVGLFAGEDNEKTKEEQLSKNLCPECNMPLQMEGKCPVCLNCGYNKCS